MDGINRNRDVSAPMIEHAQQQDEDGSCLKQMLTKHWIVFLLLAIIILLVIILIIIIASPNVPGRGHFIGKPIAEGQTTGGTFYRSQKDALAYLCLDGEKTVKKMDGIYWTNTSLNCQVFSKGIAIDGKSIIFGQAGTYEIRNAIQLDSRWMIFDKIIYLKHSMTLNGNNLQMHTESMNAYHIRVSHLHAIVRRVRQGDVLTVILSNMSFLYTQPCFNTLTIHKIEN